MSQRLLFTVGHSTHTWAEFLALLKTWKIAELADVRTVPRSKTFPWFTSKRMQSSLAGSGINYVHLPKLGGFRLPAKNSINEGWQNLRFRAYANYMQTRDFSEGLADLNRRRRQHRVCIMCSEAVWWRCHRRMIADAEVARGIPVKHIMTPSLATRHELTPFAVVQKTKGRVPQITYPAPKPGARREPGPLTTPHSRCNP